MVVARAGLMFPAPFAAWLRMRVAEAGGKQQLAGQLGVSEKRVRVWLGESDGNPRTDTGLFRICTLDRLLTSQGASLARLYGPLYEQTSIPETEACGQRCSRCKDKLREPAHLCGFCLGEICELRGHDLPARRLAA